MCAITEDHYSTQVDLLPSTCFTWGIFNIFSDVVSSLISNKNLFTKIVLYYRSKNCSIFYCVDWRQLCNVCWQRVCISYLSISHSFSIMDFIFFSFVLLQNFGKCEIIALNWVMLVTTFERSEAIIRMLNSLLRRRDLRWFVRQSKTFSTSFQPNFAAGLSCSFSAKSAFG